jgi:glutathione S-transferase
MSKPKLFYFDAPVSRGEECRLALHLAGIDFEDERMPYGVLPAWARAAERNIERGPFFGGERVHVVDLKIRSSP